MPSVLKLKGSKVDFTTANTVGSATLVRCYSADISTVTVAGDHAGSFIMPAASVTFIEKSPGDTITGTTTLSCTAVAYNT